MNNNKTDGRASRPNRKPKQGTNSSGTASRMRSLANWPRCDSTAWLQLGIQKLYLWWVWDQMKLRPRKRIDHGLSPVTPLRVRLWVYPILGQTNESNEFRPMKFIYIYIRSVLEWNHWIDLAPSWICLLLIPFVFWHPCWSQKNHPPANWIACWWNLPSFFLPRLLQGLCIGDTPGVADHLGSK